MRLQVEEAFLQGFPFLSSSPRRLRCRLRNEIINNGNLCDEKLPVKPQKQAT